MRSTSRTNVSISAKRSGAAVALSFAAMLVACGPSWAQRQKWHDTGFAFRRTVELPRSSAPPEIVVCEFHTNGAFGESRAESGELRAGVEGRAESGERRAGGESRVASRESRVESRSGVKSRESRAGVAVYGNRGPSPVQILQTGPGDFCRIAFQPGPNETQYSVYYGGQSTERTAPEWTSRAGLLFETRRWKSCNLNRLDSVRQAFATSERMGSDYVSEVFHRHNPFAVEAAPYLSRYTGELRLPLSGKCTFYTSSQDCSFLLIDGQQVVAAPGSHGPDPRARIKGEVTLKEGVHQFEYLHAAQGSESCAVAAWQLPGFEAPSPISPNVFQHDRVLHVAPDRLEHHDDGYLPDFRVAVLGDLPSPEDATAMVRVQFSNLTSKSIMGSAKYDWDFGDGQSSVHASPGHIYLHPGLYRVRLRITRGAKNLEILHAVYITRQFLVNREQQQQDEKLAAYLEVLEKYNVASLDPQALAQLVRVYLDADQPAKAVEAAKTAFAANSHTDASRWDIIQRVGPVLLNQLNDPQTAAELWVAASRLIQRKDWRLACEVEAADVLLNELLLPARAKPVLDLAGGHLQDATALLRSRYYRVLGDWYARSGNAKESRQSYEKAETGRELAYSSAERNAWRGAHSRSAEAYLRSNELDRVRSELDRWQLDFPDDKWEGYLSYVLARYWMARERFDQAAAVANDLLVVNPNSPYADRLLFLAAECEQESGRHQRATAVYESLIRDYPGSPLVDRAKQEVKRIQSGPPSGERKGSKKPKQKAVEKRP